MGLTQSFKKQRHTVYCTSNATDISSPLFCNVIGFLRSPTDVCRATRLVCKDWSNKCQGRVWERIWAALLQVEFSSAHAALGLDIRGPSYSAFTWYRLHYELDKIERRIVSQKQEVTRIRTDIKRLMRQVKHHPVTAALNVERKRLFTRSMIMVMTSCECERKMLPTQRLIDVREDLLTNVQDLSIDRENDEDQDRVLGMAQLENTDGIKYVYRGDTWRACPEHDGYTECSNPAKVEKWYNEPGSLLVRIWGECVNAGITCCCQFVPQFVPDGGLYFSMPF